MAKGAKSRTAAEAKRATKTSPPAKTTRAAPARAEAARGKAQAEPAAKRKAAAKPTAAPAKTPRSAAVAKPAAAPAAKPSKKSSKAKATASKATASKAGASKAGAPEARPAKPPAKTTRPAKPVAATAKPRKAAAQPAAAQARTRKANGAAPATRTPIPKAKPKKRPPPYLAAELGQPVDHEGEPIGAGSRAALSDTELQQYTLHLWRQMQSRRGVNLHIPAMERAGVTIDQIWTAGVTDTLTTSSTQDEVRRYKQKLLFRANLLEAILTETVSELHRLNSVEPAPSRSVGEPG